MKKNSRILYVALLVLVSVLVVVNTGIFEIVDVNTPPADTAGKALPPELQGEPDVFMEQATITQFTPNGKPKYKLYSQQLRHFEREQITRLAQPEMILYATEEDSGQKAENPWMIQSRHGYIRQRPGASALSPGPEAQLVSVASGDPVSGDREIVFLREAVKLSREDRNGTAMALKTQTLYIYPHRQFAETDQPVMIDSRVGRTKAAGFTGNLKTGIFKLASNNEQRVHTIVLPHQIKRKN